MFGIPLALQRSLLKNNIHDLDPENDRQWEYTDALIARSVELRLNFVVLKHDKLWGNTCDKMFEVIADSQIEI